MNILLMSRILAKTGVGNHIKMLSKELVSQGHSVTVVSSTNEIDVCKNLDEAHFNCVELRSNNPIVVFKSLNQLKKIIKTNEIDIVHCHHRKAALVMTLHNLFFKKTPYVWTLHLAPIPCDFFHRILTFYGKRAIAVSQGVATFLSDGFNVPKRKIKIILNGVDNSQLRPATYKEKMALRDKYGIEHDKIVFCMHSRIDEVKNHLAVVKAIKMLTSAEREKCVVLCSGEKIGNYYERVKREIIRLNVSKNFVFCGWNETKDVLGAADVLLLPSIKEGFALNCVEAMFMNVLVMRSKTMGYEDMKEGCIAFEDITPDCIHKHIREVLYGNKSVLEKTITAKKLAEEKFTVESMTKNTVSVYRDVLNKRVDIFGKQAKRKKYSKKNTCNNKVY